MLDLWYRLWYNKSSKRGDELASNYEKSVYKHLEETLKKLDIIVEENKQLKIQMKAMKVEHKLEITRLNAKID